MQTPDQNTATSAGYEPITVPIMGLMRHWLGTNGLPAVLSIEGGRGCFAGRPEREGGVKKRRCGGSSTPLPHVIGPKVFPVFFQPSQVPE